ncbi:MAG: hypothetical protein II038_06685 [Lachnospiraceae bacterium]|nr:hypothetical protein [Lachnospiraceae bacterium]
MSQERVYAGTWIIENEESSYNGELYIDSENRIIALDLIFQATEEHPIPGLPYVGHVQFIRGALFSGGKVTLYDCHTGPSVQCLGSHTRQRVYAKYLFDGLDLRDERELRFKGASIDFGEVLEWFDICRINSEVTEEPESIVYHWTKDEPREYAYNSNLTVTFTATGQFGGDRYEREYTIRQQVLVKLDYKVDVPWETIMEDVNSIRYLISLGMGQKVEIQEATYRHHLVYYDFPEQERMCRDADVLFGTGKYTPTKRHSGYKYTFTFHEFLNESGGFAGWTEKIKKMKPVLELYFSRYERSGSAVTHFLAITQALETFHARFITNSRSKYKKRVEAMIPPDKDGKRPSDKMDFLFGARQENETRSIILLSRLGDLYYAEGRLPLIGVLAPPLAFITKVSDSRNYYTHYDEAKKDLSYTEEELKRINKYLVLLLEYHLLVQLGFDPNDTRKKIAEKAGYYSFSDYSRK